MQQIGSRDPRVIVEDEKLFAGERVIVESGSARIVFPNSTSKLALNKGGKLLYQGMSANREKIILESRNFQLAITYKCFQGSHSPKSATQAI